MIYTLQSVAVVVVAEGTLTFPFTTDDADRVGDDDVELIDGAGKISTIRKGEMVFCAGYYKVEYR